MNTMDFDINAPWTKAGIDEHRRALLKKYKAMSRRHRVVQFLCFAMMVSSLAGLYLLEYQSNGVSAVLRDIIGLSVLAGGIGALTYYARKPEKDDEAKLEIRRVEGSQGWISALFGGNLVSMMMLIDLGAKNEGLMSVSLTALLIPVLLVISVVDYFRRDNVRQEILSLREANTELCSKLLEAMHCPEVARYRDAVVQQCRRFTRREASALHAHWMRWLLEKSEAQKRESCAKVYIEGFKPQKEENLA